MVSRLTPRCLCCCSCVIIACAPLNFCKAFYKPASPLLTRRTSTHSQPHLVVLLLSH